MARFHARSLNAEFAFGVRAERGRPLRYRIYIFSSVRIRDNQVLFHASSTSYRSRSSRSRAVRVVVVGRVAHPVGSSPRGAICAPVLRPLRLRHVRTGDKGNGHHDSDCRCSFHFDFLFRSLALLRLSRGKSISNLPNFRQRADYKVESCFRQTARPQARPGSLSRVFAEWHCVNREATRVSLPRCGRLKRQFVGMYLAVLGEHLDERGADDEAISNFADYLDLLLS